MLVLVCLMMPTKLFAAVAFHVFIWLQVTTSAGTESPLFILLLRMVHCHSKIKLLCIEPL